MRSDLKRGVCLWLPTQFSALRSRLLLELSLQLYTVYASSFLWKDVLRAWKDILKVSHCASLRKNTALSQVLAHALPKKEARVKKEDNFSYDFFFEDYCPGDRKFTYSGRVCHCKGRGSCNEGCSASF